MSKNRLFVDMDGTLAKFHDEVNYLERMFEKDFFCNLEPFENMVQGVRQFIQDHPNIEVFVLSARVNGEPPYCEAEKNAWLDAHLPEIDAAHRIYTDVGKSKAEYIPGGVRETDYLLDDYNKGLNLWLYDGGSAIKCHNNINQRGLGAYGGSAGMMWTGNMVHVNDKPEMIAAELAQHMGLEHSLDKVIQAYMKEGGDLDLGREELYDRMDYENFSSPLNALRFITGFSDFREYAFTTKDGTSLHPTESQLKAICKNEFNTQQENDFLAILRDEPTELAEAVKESFANASKPIVGQIHYLGSDGKVGETLNFHSVEDMKSEITSSQSVGQPITVDWFVQSKRSPLISLTKKEELSNYLTSHFEISPADAGALSTAILTPYKDRTTSQNDTLCDSWHCYNPSCSFQEFLRIPKDVFEKKMEPYMGYVNQVSNIMKDFSDKQSVQDEFAEYMLFNHSPQDAACFVLEGIQEWARWDNDDAFKAGVAEQATELHDTIVDSVKKNQHGSSLDNMIANAQKKQGVPDSKNSLVDIEH